MSSSSDERGPVGLLADEFMARCKRGEKPTIKEYCDRHPDLADEIRDVFEAVLMVEDLKPGSDDVSGSVGESTKVDGKRLAQVGDYRILCEIGRGGMGVVYEAEQQALGRRVALKVLPRTSAGDGSAQIRFQREAKAAARMHHTNIVPVFDVGQDGEHLYYAMQLIHGQGLDLVIDDLKRLRASSVVGDGWRVEGGRSLHPTPSTHHPSIAASLVAGQFEKENLAPERESESNATAAYEGSLPSSAVLPGQSDISTATTNRVAYFRSVAQIGVQTAAALSYAHSRGIIHRDIKPGNLILDTTGNVWVTDFGLAKTGDGGMTHTGDILGTVRYMSPERFRGQCDVRADVYALGMTLYELLTLKPAYASGDRLKLIEQIRQSEATSPRSVDARIPRDLETIVMKAIDKDAKRRYQSADEMGEDLQRFVNDEPIKARRIGSVERLGRWCRRNPAVAGLMAAVLVLMAVGTAVSTWQAVVANRARADLAHSHNVIGIVHDDMGKLEESLTSYRKALAIQQKLADANPAVTELQRLPLITHYNIGRLLVAMGKPEEALTEYGMALPIAQKLAHANPAVSNLQYLLGNILTNMGINLVRTGKQGEAMEAYRKALVIFQKLTAANPAVADFQYVLSLSHNRIGDVLSKTGKPQEAMASHLEALAICRKLSATNPTVTYYQDNLATAHISVGRLLARQKRFAEAFTALDAGLTIYKKLTEANPKDRVETRGLGYGHAYRGWALIRSGQPSGATADLRQALEMWSRNKTLDSTDLFEQSRTLALLAGLGGEAKSGVTTAEAASFADQAVASLRDALSAGWGWPDELKEPDFDALRGRDDFQKLLAAVEAKAEPKAK